MVVYSYYPSKLVGIGEVMKLSTRARYGLRLSYLLAVSEGGSESIKSMATKANLSEKYLEQIISKLKKRGIVLSQRGQKGGYCLNKKPCDISINEILLAMEDTFEFTACATGGCEDEKCPNKLIFSKLYSKINSVLNDYTLQNMVDENSQQCK